MPVLLLIEKEISPNFLVYELVDDTHKCALDYWLCRNGEDQSRMDKELADLLEYEQTL